MLEEPLGNARLHGSRLIAALLHTNTPSINLELCRLGTMDLLLVSTCSGVLGSALCRGVGLLLFPSLPLALEELLCSWGSFCAPSDCSGFWTEPHL